jgi:hypothetical protein
MKYFIDFEFLEGDVPQRICGFNIPRWLSKPNNTIQPISIGIVSEDGREYYAISKDFNLKEAWNRWQQRTGEGDRNNLEPRLYWIRDNILKPLMQDARYRYDFPSTDGNKFKGRFDYKDFKYCINKYGKTNKQIAEEIIEFCNPIKNGGIVKLSERQEEMLKPIFYGYYCDYDWVCFCWLFGKMIDLPKGFPQYCIDIKQTLDEKAIEWANQEKGIRLMNFDEQLDYFKLQDNYPKQTNEHNTLPDDIWNYELYKFLKIL